jgi:hypothetical protein
MRQTKPGTAALVLAAIGSLVIGCANPAQPMPEKPEAAPGAFDPAAERLHDITGSLLLFRGAYGRMPTDLDELRLVTGLTSDATIDPATDKPFAYSREGFASSAGGRRLYVLAAPTPQRKSCLAVSITTGPGSGTGDVEVLPPEAYAKMTTGDSSNP